MDDLLLAVRAVDVTKIPVMSRDKSISLKEQAALARNLFKQLGIRVKSVRKAIGANCHFVVIEFPRTGQLKDDQYIDKQLEEILARAFPNHEDRSDVMTDYFDTCWIIRGT